MNYFNGYNTNSIENVENTEVAGVAKIDESNKTSETTKTVSKNRITENDVLNLQINETKMNELLNEFIQSTKRYSPAQMLLQKFDKQLKILCDNKVSFTKIQEYICKLTEITVDKQTIKTYCIKRKYYTTKKQNNNHQTKKD